MSFPYMIGTDHSRKTETDPTMSERHTEISKFLSFVLRHKPEAIGLELDPESRAGSAPRLTA
jgi:RNA:NAD 2'-phosphotransferase (TPT1/KptA family)